ncbi:hypothetical protein L6E12_17500 [Actinokineospora sp. PR83]|uniref:hypothetical protein n=1 Tax=Actinokineospora sp. PR83 TaxID=2884908 RepID=UPI001F24F792|nr:hypothetical protein [Actinokineospora sp. PR83]MCG8917582.1 hypothetical protein [Actinokineospora sp. PR83]
MPAPSTPGIGAVAIWSTTDLPGWGDQVLGRVVEQALTSRLPGWRATQFAPLGWSRPTRADGGIAAEPLGTPTPTRIADITASADASVLAPATPLGTDPYDGAAPGVRFFDTPGVGHPIAYSGVRFTRCDGPVTAEVVAVRDQASHELLRAAGAEAEVVPHPAIAVAALVDPGTFAERLVQLRTLGLLPEGDYTLATSPGLAADAVEVPGDWVLEDRLAALVGARLVLTADEHAAAVAAGIGANWLLVTEPGSPDAAVVAEFAPPARIATGGQRTVPAGTPTCDPAAHDRLAAHFDRLAAAVEAARADRDGELHRRLSALAGENAAVRTAHWRLRQRMLVERRRVTEPYATALQDLADSRATTAERDATIAAQQAHIAELERANADLVARLAAAERELTAWRDTKLVRWSEPLRRAYGKARG